MSVTLEKPALLSQGFALDESKEAFGTLRDSSAIVTNGPALAARMEEDGYLFLPGLLNREEVIVVRNEILQRAAADGILDPDHPVSEGILKAGLNPYFKPEYAQNNEALNRMLYDGPMMALFERFFGEPVRHFDFTWLRVVGVGSGTSPHCDTVFMGRGTQNLLTAWTPLGDVPLSLGGLMLLENSHRRTDVLGDYLRQDVDSYCENGPNATAAKAGKYNWEHWDGSFSQWNGAITPNPVTLRETLQGRWLTCPEYRMGDVLIFTIRTVHGSLDNQTQRLRLSTDTRYQRASEPADERWIGANPVGHGAGGKQGKIC